MTEDGPDEDADVPDWCSFFSTDEFEAFREAVDDALSAFGAEGQDLWNGLVTLASGNPHIDVYEFRLDALAPTAVPFRRKTGNWIVFHRSTAGWRGSLKRIGLPQHNGDGTWTPPNP